MLMHELAKARVAFQLSATRQSRFTVWTTFSTLCLRKVVAASSDSNAPAQTPKVFKPSCVVKKDSPKDRDYQILAARSHTTATVKLCLVQSVFRGAIRKKVDGGSRHQSVCKIFADPLPVQTCARLHLLALMPASDQEFEATCLGPMLILDARRPTERTLCKTHADCNASSATL